VTVGAGEVDGQAIAALVDAHPDPERLIVLVAVLEHAVAVAEILEVGGAVG